MMSIPTAEQVNNDDVDEIRPLLPESQGVHFAMQHGTEIHCHTVRERGNAVDRLTLLTQSAYLHTSYTRVFRPMAGLFKPATSTEWHTPLAYEIIALGPRSLALFSSQKITTYLQQRYPYKTFQQNLTFDENAQSKESDGMLKSRNEGHSRCSWQDWFIVRIDP